MLCSEIEEKSKKVDREVLYLLNKLRSYPKPKPKAKKQANNTANVTDNAKSHSTGDSTTEPPTISEGESDKANDEPAPEETPMDASDPLGLLLRGGCDSSNFYGCVEAVYGVGALSVS